MRVWIQTSPFGMKLRRLRDTLHARDFGQQDCEEAGLVEQLEGAARGALGEQFGELVAQALCGNFRDLRRE